MLYYDRIDVSVESDVNKQVIKRVPYLLLFTGLSFNFMSTMVVVMY